MFTWVFRRGIIIAYVAKRQNGINVARDTEAGNTIWLLVCNTVCCYEIGYNDIL